MKLTKLDVRGFTHDIILVLFVVVFAVAGVGYMLVSRAAESPAYLGVNGATCNLSGWASEDLANSSEVVKVDVYANGPWAINGGGTYIGEVTNGGHGYPANNPSWSMAIPPGYLGKATTFYVYAINQGGVVSGPAGGVLSSAVGGIYGTDPIVSTPSSACPGPPPPVSNNEPAPDLAINTADCTNGLSGWASEGLASSSEVINIDVYANGPWAINGGGTYIGQVNNGGHGYPGINPSWYMPIPAKYQSIPTVFYVYAINQGGTVTGPVGGVFSSAVGPIYGNDPITSTPCTSPPPSGGGSGGTGSTGGTTLGTITAGGTLTGPYCDTSFTGTNAQLTPIIATVDAIHNICNNSYPKIVSIMGVNSLYPQPNKVVFTSSLTKYPASTLGNTTQMSISYFSTAYGKTDYGVIVHEETHVVQSYGSKFYTAQAPPWITEGMPDYVRHKLGYVVAANWTCKGTNFLGGYDCGGVLLNYIMNTYNDPYLIKQLNTTIRAGKYNGSTFFNNITHNTMTPTQIYNQCLKSACAGGTSVPANNTIPT